LSVLRRGGPVCRVEHRLQLEGKLQRAIRVGVRSEDGPREIVGEADLVVDGTAGVQSLLATLAAAGATLVGVPIGYVIVRYRRFSALLAVVATSPFATAWTAVASSMRPTLMRRSFHCDPSW